MFRTDTNTFLIHFIEVDLDNDREKLTVYAIAIVINNATRSYVDTIHIITQSPQQKEFYCYFMSHPDTSNQMTIDSHDLLTSLLNSASQEYFEKNGAYPTGFHH